MGPGRFGPRRSGTPPNMDAPFEWESPDRKYGGGWWEARLNKLGNINQGWHDHDDVMIEGRRLLASHRLKHTFQGAQRLEILWWEWPPEHWELLRFGGSMNFMETPTPLRVSSKLQCFCDRTA
jgi:hypothetical protein